MNEPQSLKLALFDFCKKNIANRIDTIQRRLKDIEASRDNETKSSVGDKYETGRAMMQLELEKASVQLSDAVQVQNRLLNINIEKPSDTVIPGSLVITNTGKYFLSVGVGKIPFDGVVYYGISPASPIGKLLLHKKTGDEFNFNNKEIVIKKIL